MPYPDDDTPSAAYGPPVVMAPPTVGNPAAANAYAQQHRDAIAGREGDIQGVMKQQEDAASRMSRIIDETTAALKESRGGQSNLPLLAFGAGMLSSNGNFGRQLGEGLKGMVPVVQQQRAEDDSFQKDIANLALKRAGLEQAPLASRLAYMKALQVGDINALRAIEQAQIRTEGRLGTTGQDPAKLKIFKAWQQVPGNENKTLEDYDRYQAGLGGDSKAPALVKEFNVWSAPGGPGEGKSFEDYQKFKESTKKPAALKEFDEWKTTPGNEDKSFDDFVSTKAFKGAAGRETGTEQAKAAQALPTVLNSLNTADTLINDLKKHPGIDNAVGKMWASVPPIPGTPKADFLAKYDNLMGKVFMNAYNNLRGAGAITEAEGLKAIQSELAASRNQSKEAFLSNLEIYQQKLQEYQDIARQKAGGKGAAAVAAPTNSGHPDLPPVPEAKKAPDGHWYVKDPAREGKYMRVD